MKCYPNITAIVINVKLPSSFPKDTVEASRPRDGSHRESVCMNDLGFLYGEMLLSYPFIYTFMCSSMDSCFAVAFCIIMLYICGYHIYGFNHLY